MYIYIDIVIVLNLCINSVILFFTAWLLNLQYRYYRIILAVCLMTAYVIVALLDTAGLMTNPLGKFLFSLVILAIAFKFTDWRQFFATVGVFYLIACLLGGAVLGYNFFLQRLAFDAPISFSLSNVIQGILFGSLLAFGILKIVIRKKTKAEYLYEIEITLAGKTVRLSGLFDSGNHLYALGSGKPVVLVEEMIVRQLLSPEVVEYLAHTAVKDWISRLSDCVDLEWQKRSAVIAYRSVGNADFLLGCRMDAVKICDKSSKWHEFSCVIGIYPGKLSPDNNYQALLHSSMAMD